MSTPDALPRSVIAFLRAHVDHIVTLRFLLAMHAAPGGTTTLSQLGRALAISPTRLRETAQRLVSDGLLRVTGESLELAPTIDERLALADLAQSYDRHRAAVIAALHAMGRG